MPNKCEIYVGRQFFAQGDADAMRSVFKCLIGNAFDSLSNADERHTTWLKKTEVNHSIRLPLLALVRLENSSGELMAEGCIGTGIPRPDPELKNQYMVNICPYGTTNVWRLATLIDHEQATSINREKFHFNGQSGVCTITRSELKDRVMPAQPAPDLAAMNREVERNLGRLAI